MLSKLLIPVKIRKIYNRFDDAVKVSNKDVIDLIFRDVPRDNDASNVVADMSKEETWKKLIEVAIHMIKVIISTDMDDELEEFWADSDKHLTDLEKEHVPFSVLDEVSKKILVSFEYIREFERISE